MAEKDNMKVNTSPVADVETGTAEDVEAIMKKSTTVNRIPESGKAPRSRSFVSFWQRFQFPRSI